MIDTKKFVDHLINNYGVKEFCGVSDSTLKYLIIELENRGIYKPFTNEGDAVAYAAGRTSGGVFTAVLMQNSGLTNASSPISSLTSLYGIPYMYIVGWRGIPGKEDEPQHKIIGKTMLSFIYSIAPDSRAVPAEYIIKNKKALENKQLFITVSPGQLSPIEPKVPYCSSSSVSRYSVLSLIDKLRDENTVVVSTTGYTSRELMTFGETNPKNFYMLGSMGCVYSFAYGVAKSCPSKKVIVLDGDGSFLMRPEGTYACNKLDDCNNILHIIFNNQMHLSTGKQVLPQSDSSEFCRIVRSCKQQGYVLIDEMYSPDVIRRFTGELSEWIKSPYNLTMVVSVSDETLEDLPRPIQSPQEIYQKFSKEVRTCDSNS